MLFGTTFAGLLPDISGGIGLPVAGGVLSSQLPAKEMVDVSISNLTVKLSGEIDSSLDAAAWGALGKIGGTAVSLHNLIDDNIGLVTTEQQVVHNADGTTTVTYTSNHWDGVQKIVQGMGQKLDSSVHDSAGALTDLLKNAGTHIGDQMLGFVNDLPDKLQDAISLSGWIAAFPGQHVNA